MAEETGKRIWKLRQQNGLTQEQLGQRLGVSGQAVSKWENGDSLPDTGLLVSLSRTLECTTDYLLGADGGGGAELYVPQLQEELKSMTPEQKIDLAFKLFHLIDAPSLAHMAPSLHKAVRDSGALPFVHAGPDGVTIGWQGKFLCSVTLDALREAESIWSESLAFELFPAEQRAVLAAVLAHKQSLFLPDTGVTEDELRSRFPVDGDFGAAVEHWVEAGMLEKGKGGYRMGIRAEVLIRVMAVLFRSIWKPGVITTRSAKAPEGSVQG
ncbi:helix-turn-helix transcriptional regulator [Paenibacillus ginsengarvi]|uniref:XRE family transcriptional regulator n=1 Tax=Paenibacillus ginsengarvi TaxID=400777 RepID=A0A3B0CTI8_9BACL|nr:helix-turn-helix transcriptional regulator [Paenibacillus ginsengarvi]RKN86036.1 XRE family transcriptional regulator [Paenibacillus ginsengarvi]